MRRFFLLIVMLIAISRSNLVQGHGLPITVGADEDGIALVVSQVPAPVGYPPSIFLEEGEFSDPFPPVTLPKLGPAIVWDLPGFEINGLVESSLSIEVLPRAVAGSDPAEERVLWYWHPQNGVQPAASTAAFYLLGSEMRYTTIAPPDGPAPPPFELASSVSGQQGFHNHDLLSYALDNSPTAATGVYAFFARLTSNLYEPSNPILLIFNRGVDYEQLIPAALAIDAAAVEPGAGDFLAGDYNGNDVIDAADYTVWRDALSAASSTLLNDPTPGTVDESDFLYWRSHFGETLGSGAGATGSARAWAVVPEPASWLLAVVAALLLPCKARKRRRVPCLQRLRAR
jgi:hypothetical protein